MFHSQFQLAIDKYHDNNNYLQYNKVTNQYRRIWFHKPPFVTEFFNLKQYQSWVSDLYTKPREVSYDGGKSYVLEN